MLGAAERPPTYRRMTSKLAGRLAKSLSNNLIQPSDMVWFFTELSDEASVRAPLSDSKLSFRLCETFRPEMTSKDSTDVWKPQIHVGSDEHAVG